MDDDFNKRPESVLREAADVLQFHRVGATLVPANESARDACIGISGGEAPSYRFGQVSAALARAIAVPDDQITEFHARLKNFRRLGWPVVEGVKGKATLYTRHDFICFAVVCELTALGFPPERAIEIARRNQLRFGSGLQILNLLVPPNIGAKPMRSAIMLYVGHYMLEMPNG